ncbi:MAG: dUTP diphosphatase [Treponema sp.]|jgi:dUTP pyrophosphatase|nr:dUTP diphosphatase [Treponema sp.]
MAEGSAVSLKIMRKDPRVSLPEYASEGAAGMDLRAFLQKEVLMPPMGRAKIPTGLYVEIPQGYEAQIRPRSGLAARHGVTILNSPGTIDSDYRGELEILLVNLGIEPFVIQNGDRIAQLVIAPVARLPVEESGELSETMRGRRGFGSTGI